MGVKSARGMLLHRDLGIFALQKQIDPSGVPAAGDSEVNVAAAAQEKVTEEAIASPLAMWELEIQNIELEKGEGGLGFSILDYQVGRIAVCSVHVLLHLLSS